MRKLKLKIGHRGAIVCLSMMFIAAPFPVVSGTSSASSLGSASTLNLIIHPPSGDFDPNTVVGGEGGRIMDLIYEPLLDYGPQNQLIPALAKSWTVASNGLSITFHIQPLGRFSNGSEVTSQDVKFTLDRLASGLTMGSYLTDMKSVDIINSKTFRIDLKQRSRVFLNTLATTATAGILSETAVKSNPGYFSMPTVTSGAWSMKSYVFDASAQLVANPYYWDSGYPKIKTLNFTFSTDETAEVSAIESGTAQFTDGITPSDGLRLEKQGFTVLENKSAGLIGFGVDKLKPPFSDVRVRLAVAYLAPRASAFKVCWDGFGPASYGNLIFPGNPLYTKGSNPFSISTSAALAKANALLNAAGWKLGPGHVREAEGVKGVANGTKLAFDVPYEDDWVQAACNTQLLQAALLPAGIEATPKAYDASTFYTAVAKDEFTMYHTGDDFASVDAEFSDAFTCAGGAVDIMAKWCNPTVDKLVSEAQETYSVTKAAALYGQVQAIVLQQQPIIVTGAQYGVMAAASKLRGFYARPDDSIRPLIKSSLSG